MTSSDGSGDEHRRRAGWPHFIKPPAGASKQLLPLLTRSLASAGGDHHVEVTKLARRALIGAGEHPLDDQQHAVWPSRGADGLMDASTILVIPVMKDRLQEVYVGAGRYRFEEITRHQLTALSDARRCNKGMCIGDRAWQVEQTPREPGFAFRISVSRRPPPPPTSTTVVAVTVAHRARFWHMTAGTFCPSGG